MLLGMTSDQDELYQAVIQDHFQRPRNHGLLHRSTHSGAAHNPFCGDTVRISLEIRDRRVERVGFEGRGCSISQAAASMLSDVITGLDAADADRLVAEFVRQLGSTDPFSPELGDLRALVGVRRFPNRIRCATLAAEAFNRATSED